MFQQINTYRFTGHSPADPEHERGRKEEKKWARAEADPIVIFEEEVREEGMHACLYAHVCVGVVG